MIVRDENDMLALGARLAEVVQPGDVIALRGGLGAGKTTLARGLLSSLGLEEEAPSPSFAIVQPYDPPLVRVPVTHVDLYRLENAAEAEELGLDELLCDSLLLIEWPERLGAALWPHSLILDIATSPDGTRLLTATVPAAWKNRWPLK
ncbi:MAG TPA: tRNA (adenosine(37)-N6)-threonylcarbamoyltransferase complex ATPase subunit type 1 TsaE [Rhizorhapis sp.]